MRVQPKKVLMGVTSSCGEANNNVQTNEHGGSQFTLIMTGVIYHKQCKLQVHGDS